MTRLNKILVKNLTEKRRVLTLEPWAEQYILLPGRIIEVRQECAEESETIELEYSDLGITVYTGGVSKVFCDGEELSPVHPWINLIE